MDRGDAALAPDQYGGSGMRLTDERPVVLAIAGSDSSGGAGIAADIRAAHDLGASLRFALTAVTAQSDGAVASIHPVPVEVLRDQIKLALEDGRVGSVKVGMLGTAVTVEAVADILAAHRHLPIVLDPVVASSSGHRLLDDPAMAVFIERMLPVATLVTPNLPELQILAAACGAVEPPATVGEQADIILAAGAEAVLVKGGHGDGDRAEDRLFQAGVSASNRFSSKRLPVKLRGTGCALATRIAIFLARGETLAASCHRGKRQMTALLERATEDGDPRIG